MLLTTLGLIGCGDRIPLDEPLVRLSALTPAQVDALECERTAVRAWQRPLRWERDCTGFPDDAYVSVHLDWRGHVTQVARVWEASDARRWEVLRDSVRDAMIAGREAALCRTFDDTVFVRQELWRVSRYVLELSTYRPGGPGTTEREYRVRAVLSEAPVGDCPPSAPGS